MTLTLKPDAAPEAPAPQNHATPMAEARRLVDQIERGELQDDGAQPVTARLAPRFADYLAQRAEAHGETPEAHLATILRQFRQTDPWRITDSRPQAMGQQAGSGRR